MFSARPLPLRMCSTQAGGQPLLPVSQGTQGSLGPGVPTGRTFQSKDSQPVQTASTSPTSILPHCFPGVRCHLDPPPVQADGQWDRQGAKEGAKGVRPPAEAEAAVRWGSQRAWAAAE